MIKKKPDQILNLLLIFSIIISIKDIKFIFKNQNADFTFLDIQENYLYI